MLACRRRQHIYSALLPGLEFSKLVPVASGRPSKKGSYLEQDFPGKGCPARRRWEASWPVEARLLITTLQIRYIPVAGVAGSGK